MKIERFPCISYRSLGSMWVVGIQYILVYQLIFIKVVAAQTKYLKLIVMLPRNSKVLSKFLVNLTSINSIKFFLEEIHLNFVVVIRKYTRLWSTLLFSWFNFNSVIWIVLGWANVSLYAAFSIFSLFCKYLFIHERQRGRGTGRGRSRLPARSPMRDSIPGPQDHALSRRQMLNHWAPRRPSSKFFKGHPFRGMGQLMVELYSRWTESLWHPLLKIP